MGSALITTGIAPESYACVRALAKRDVNTIVASEFPISPATTSRFCDDVVSVPDPQEDLIAYKEALLNIVARSDVQTILPLRTVDPYLFTKYEDEFSEYVSLVTPSSESLEMVHDRIQLTAAAEEAGVRTPETTLLDRISDWDSERIIKSRYNLLTGENSTSYTSRDVKTIKKVAHLRPGHRPDVKSICEEMDHVPIVQEYIHAADEYVFGALCDKGEPLATFQHRQIRGDSYTGGGGVYRTSVDIPELEQANKALLDQLNWHGLACIEFMKDEETGEFVLTEINPRLWQSLPCAISAGANFPYYYWLQATGHADLIEPSYEVDVGSHLLYGEVEHLLSILREESPFVPRPNLARTITEIMISCYQTPNFDNLHFDDPLPFVSGLSYMLTEKLGR